METLGLNPGFWKDKRILLTGHTGFKGSWMALWLSHMGAEVQGYALAPDTTPSLFQLASVDQHLVSHIADIRDYAVFEKICSQFQPEIILHMASQPLVRRSYREPLLTMETNIMGTANVLEVARQTQSLQALLVVTSDKCYRNNGSQPRYSEDDPMGGQDPYSASKACAELITAAYRDSFFSSGAVVASARAGNVYGGGDWSEDRLIPDAIRSLSDGTQLMIRYPQAVRPWQFVLDPLHGYLLLLQKMMGSGSAYAGGWNFGPAKEDEVTVETLLSRFGDAYGQKIDWQLESVQQPHEADCLRLDASKSQSRLGWSASWSLDKGLKETADWYRSVKDKPDSARGLSLALIDQFVSDIS